MGYYSDVFGGWDPPTPRKTDIHIYAIIIFSQGWCTKLKAYTFWLLLKHISFLRPDKLEFCSRPPRWYWHSILFLSGKNTNEKYKQKTNANKQMLLCIGNETREKIKTWACQHQFTISSQSWRTVSQSQIWLPSLIVHGQ